MGSDDLFKKRRAERQQRKHEFKIPKANSFLIVTEGERTEPLYFNGLKKLIEEKIGGMVDIVEVPTIDVFGEGSSTEKLIEITEKRVKDAKIFYQNIWLVFDKDDFEDFDVYDKYDEEVVEKQKDSYHFECGLKFETSIGGIKNIGQIILVNQMERYRIYDTWNRNS